MRRHSLKIGFVITMVWLLGCSRIEKVDVLKGDMTKPYQSLGGLEVEADAIVASPWNLLWGATEAVTLTMADTPTRAERYQRKLDRKLRTIARERYGADAVINPEYWPDLNQASFPGGKIRARGEMIRYKPFPEPAASEVLGENPSKPS